MPRHDGISCPLQVECQQEAGDERQLSLTLQHQTVASDTEVRVQQRHWCARPSSFGRCC